MSQLKVLHIQANTMYPQDLHIHTTYSVNDTAVVPEQTVALISRVKHAEVTGISDHFENFTSGTFDHYCRDIRAAGFKLGVEVDGYQWVKEAYEYPVDYFIFHCYDRDAEYKAVEQLLSAEVPVIIAHPNALGTDLNRLPPECIVEINNRYVWRNDWRGYYRPFTENFRFVIGSDAHQPHWLSQAVARSAARELGIKEHLLFET